MDYRKQAPDGLYDSWVGMDLDIATCQEPAYTALIEANAERDVPGEPADIYLLLHVLEHMYDPQRALARLTASAPPGAAFVLGVPSHPHWTIRWRERWIRENTNANGHVSAFSRRRLRETAEAAGLQVELEQAGYFLRSSGSWLEDRAGWHRFNIFFGGVFPGWPGEYYCLGRKPA